MNKLSLLPVVMLACTTCTTNKGYSPYETLIQRRLASMTLEEKAGQMIQINLDVICDAASGKIIPEKLDEAISKFKIGSVLNVISGHCPSSQWMSGIIRSIQAKSMKELGIPCIYGLDMIHGATYLDNGTFFPQEINLAATFNPEHAANMGRIIAYETRSMQVPWVFSPVMDLGRNPLWPRMYESWGEDPYVQTVMSEVETRAIQGESRDSIGIQNCAVSVKHYMGYGVPASGKDRTPAYIPEYELRERYFRPFKACLEAGALTMMVNSASINGIPMHANRKFLTEWTKEELGWDGMVVTDWADIDNLYQREHIASDRLESIAVGINAGIDMIMVPYNPEIAEDICSLVRDGRIPMSRIDDAVARILRLKYRLGLFENPVWGEDYPSVGSSDFAALAKEAAVQSEVLLKNDGILPLRRDARILVTGPNAGSVRTLNGGWSYTWQGTDNKDYTAPFNSILDALKTKFSYVIYEPGMTYCQSGKWWKEENVDIQAAVKAAENADVVVVCVGENSYCETPGNINDLSMSKNQRNLVKALAAAGKKIVLILNEGRPRIINDIEPMASAIVDIILPGNYGGDALAELLCGERNFSGKLPFTYPKYVNSLHTYDYKVSENCAMMGGAYNYDAVMDVQWPFGFGLSYTRFSYSNLKVSPANFTGDSEIGVMVDVRNEGDIAGDEIVLVYSSDIVASMIPDVKRLRAFTRISLQPGECRTVRLSIPARELAFAGDDGNWHLEKGAFRIGVGGLGEVINCVRTDEWK